MSSFDLNQASIEEEEHDLRVPNHGLLTTLYHRSSDYNCITFSQHGQQHGHKDQILFMAGSNCNDHSLIAAKKSHRDDDLELSLCDPFSSFEREKEEEEEELGIRERNWMAPSKMRLMRKMMKYSTTHMIVSKPSSSQDEIQPDRGFPLKNIITRKNNNDNSILSSDIIRVCSDCNTTKTPLWRSGPCGPKSLCNACGIRQRKARRAMATALNGVGLPNDGGGHATATMSMTNKIRKQKKLGIDRTDLPFKKRCKMNIRTAPPPPPPPPERIRFEDATLLDSDEHNSSSTVLQKAVFLQEERDAAILLMDLSCGIIHS